MSTPAAKLDILIDIQAKLSELLKVQQGVRETKEEAMSLGGLFRQGLGIGTGMEIARRGIEIVKALIVDSTREAFRLAGQLKDTAENLQISTEALQVLGMVAEDGGANMEKLTQSLVHLKRASGEAQTGVGATATIFNTLGIEAARFAELPLERQLETFAKAVVGAKDQSRAFNDALTVLGGRTAPQLMNMLRDLAGEGYDKLSASIRASGRIMEEETIQRLDRAQKQIERLKRGIVIFAGESIASLSKMFGVGGGPVASSALLPSGDFWTGYNKQALTAGQSQLNMLRETFGAQQRNAADSPFHNLNDAVAISFLTKMRDRLAENIRLASEDLPDAFRGLAKTAQDKFPSGLDQMLPFGTPMKDVLQGLSDENLKKIEAVNKALAEYRDLTTQIAAIQKPRSAAENLRIEFEGINNPKANPNYLTPGQGVVAGFQGWATQMGSVGQQVAGTIQGTIGSALSGVSTGIMGLITKTKSLGDVGREMGAMFVQALIDMTVRALAFAAVIAILNFFAPGAGTAAAASYSASQGRASGGPVSAGTPYIVGENRPEVFVPSVPGTIVPSVEQFERTSPGLAASSPVGPSKPRMYLMRPSTQQEFDAMRRLPDWDVHIVDTVSRRKGEILNG